MGSTHGALKQGRSTTTSRKGNSASKQQENKGLTRGPASLPPLPGKRGACLTLLPGDWPNPEVILENLLFYRGPRQSAWVYDHELVSEAGWRRLEPGRPDSPAPKRFREPPRCSPGGSISRPDSRGGSLSLGPAADAVACPFSHRISFQLLGVRSSSFLFPQLSIEVESVPFFAPVGISTLRLSAPELCCSLRQTRHSSVTKIQLLSDNWNNIT